MILPANSLGPLLGFVPLPALFFMYLFAAFVSYPLLVEVIKRRVLAHDVPVS